MSENEQIDKERISQELPEEPWARKGPGTPASEADRLTTAADETPESAHGPDARRAEAAWDTIPGDSSASFDYPVKGDGLAEVRPLKLQTLESSDVPDPALNVDVIVRLPNGKTWNLNLEVPDPDMDLSNATLLAEVLDHFDAVEAMLKQVLPVSPTRAVLGLDE